MILNTVLNSLRSKVSQWGILCCCLLICTLCVTSGVLAQTSFGKAGKAQTGDLGNFKNGFEIDGNLPANNFINPDSVGSDWTPTPAGFSGLGEAHINCSKVVLSTADGGLMIYSQDGVAGIDNDSSVFAQSNKVNDNPNTYNYKEGTVSQKTDIQNIQIHLSPDASGDLWFVGSGDRKATNGDSFIGVEFLQAGLVKTPLNNQGVGGFFTTGPDSGRTVGDLRLDTRFLNGGSNPTIFISKWQLVGSVFKWVDLTVASVDTTKIFIAGNSDSADVCYGAFGSTKYKPNAFLEFAVNFSSLVGGSDPCKKFNSIFVYTRSSHSETASMEDFGGLFGFDFCTDVEPPTVTFCPTNQTIQCTATPVFGTPTFTDNCEVDHIDSNTVTTPGNCPQEYSVTRTWTAFDNCGNTAQCSQTIDVVDDTPPVITCPADQNFECNAIGAFNNATATDNCDQSVTPTEVRDTSGSCPIQIRRIWTATDDCGNASTCTSFVNIDDTTSPQLTCPADQTFECSSIGTFNSASATDGCDPSVTVAEVRDTSGTCPVNIRRIFTATDDCGNTSICTSFVHIDDTQAPQLTCPAEQTFDCNAIGAFGSASATDNCDASVTITEARDTSGTCPVNIRRIFTATDDCGNTSTCTSFVHIDDTTSPQITCPATQNFECDAVGAFGSASATDDCDASVSISEVRDTLGGQCPFVIRRIFTATDDCGNTAVCTSFVNINDTQAPQLTCPAEQTFECDAVGTFGSASATDNCDVSVTVTEARDTSGTCPVNIRRIFTATDDCGNTTKCTTFVHIDDTTPPQLTCPADQTFECNAVGAFDNATATDNCDQSVTPTEVRDTTVGSCLQNLDIRRIWTSTDDCGNVSKCTSFVHIADTRPPTISCPAPPPVGCPPTPVFPPPTASDTCDPNPTVTFAADTTQGTPPGGYTITRTWTATDDCGNSASCSQSVPIVQSADTGDCGSEGPITSGFELDGNANSVAPNLPDDWDSVYTGGSNATSTTGVITDVPSKNDNSFTIGTKDIGDVSSWHHTTQSTPDKNDILHAGAAQYNSQLYFFADRYAVNGNAQIGFWFFKNDVHLLSGGTFSGTHAIGDLLVLSNFVGGGGTPVIFAYEWVGSGGSDGTLDKLTLSASNSFAITNSGSSTPPWPYDPKSGPSNQYRAGAFFEGGIDLACLPGIDPCFTSFLVETRASASVTAELKDFVIGSFSVVQSPAIVHKAKAARFDIGEKTPNAAIPAEFSLYANYPNPFNPTTLIKFDLPEASTVRLSIFNVLGQEVATLVNGSIEAGYHSVDWNSTSNNGTVLPSGIYMYRISATSSITGIEFSQVRKMVLMK